MAKTTGDRTMRPDVEDRTTFLVGVRTRILAVCATAPADHVGSRRHNARVAADRRPKGGRDRERAAWSRAGVWKEGGPDLAGESEAEAVVSATRKPWDAEGT